jgi:signal transduction histidine kinase
MADLTIALAAALLLTGAAAVLARLAGPAVSSWGVASALVVISTAQQLDASPTSQAVAFAVLPAIAPSVAILLLPARRVLWPALGAGILAGPVRGAVYDPYYDAECRTYCDPSPIAVAHVGAATATLLAWSAALSVVCLGWAALRRADRLPLVALACAQILALPVVGQVTLSGIVTGSVTLAIAGRQVLVAFERRARVADLTRALDRAADLQTTMRAEVGDPTLTVAYWLDDDQRLVDDHGRPAPPPQAHQVTVDVVGEDGLVARVHLDPAATDADVVLQTAAGPARLALENGRLVSRTLSQARNVAASRRRILSSADDARRSLERDLHDGAQQHVLSLGLELQREVQDSDGPNRDVAARCLAATQHVLLDLRRIAHGVYPATLAYAGLADALHTLADASPVPIAVRATPIGPLDDELARAILLLVRDIAVGATHPLDVTVTATDSAFEAEVVGGSLRTPAVRDVFEVLGGTIQSLDDHGSVPRVRAVLPIEPDRGAP